MKVSDSREIQVSISAKENSMEAKSNVLQLIHKHFEKTEIHEFAFFCIARQGGRTALEVLARAYIQEGKYAYIGQNLTGLRSMGTNNIIARFADTPDIPSGISVTHPRGIMIMHEALMWPEPSFVLSAPQINRAEVIKNCRDGILMVCTPRSPEKIEYPVDFEGTVATVDAEAIFSKRVGIQPAPSGITALGLFLAATGDSVKVESVKQAIMDHDRLNKRVREVNVACMEDAYEKTSVVHDFKLKGTMSLEQYDEIANRPPASGIITSRDKSVSTKWRTKIPVCDMTKCVCIECLSAYSCPEGVISWEDEVFKVDYDFCKGCGTCLLECPEHAITMEDEAAVMNRLMAEQA
jgi:2-oxoacid:acceptor oxidoreductase delta subunit (pyruvate/2-ketoisovalerate family)